VPEGKLWRRHYRRLREGLLKYIEEELSLTPVMKAISEKREKPVTQSSQRERGRL